MSKFIIKYSEGLIANSYYVKNELIHFFKVNEQKVKVVYIPCDLNRFYNKNEKNITISTKQKLILTVSNFNFLGKAEALKKALPALVNVLEKRNDTILGIAGDGFYLKDIKKLVSNRYNHVANKILFYGFVKNIEKLYRKAEIFVYFSYQDAYPNVILEAMASGKPIVTNYFGGMKEQIIHFKDGLFVDLEKREEIFKTIIQLLDSPQLRNYLGKNAKRRVEQENSYKKIGNDFKKAITDLGFVL